MTKDEIAAALERAAAWLDDPDDAALLRALRDALMQGPVAWLAFKNGTVELSEACVWLSYEDGRAYEEDDGIELRPVYAIPLPESKP